MPVAIYNTNTYEEEIIQKSLSVMFSMLGFDRDNPFGHFIQPGNKVFIKPNWVTHEYRKSCKDQDNIYSCITHPSIIRAVADYVAIALNGVGEIIIGDNPSIDANFNILMNLMRLDDLQNRYEVPCSILDLRPLYCADLADYGNKSKMKRQEGDPKGTTVFNLGKDSALSGINPLLLRGIFNNRLETIMHHRRKTHEYGLSNSIMNADVYISLPKLKTHHKVGTTLNIKGLVGVNAIKNYLVHWRVGWPSIGGDEYPDFKSWLKSKLQHVTYRGAWNGNDTIWRMVVDLYNIFNNNGPSKCFSIIDGIIGGQKNGPFCPTAKESGVLIAGSNFLDVDIVASRLMGFNIMEIPYLRYLIECNNLNYRKIELLAPQYNIKEFFDNRSRNINFLPPPNWLNLLNETDNISHTIGRYITN